MKNFFKFALPVFAFVFVWFLVFAKGFCAEDLTGVVYESPFTYNSANQYFLTTDSGFIAGYKNGNSIFWYSKDNSLIYLNGSVPYASGQLSSLSSTVDSNVKYFTDLDSMLSALRNASSSSFDDSIMLGRFFYTRIDFYGVPLSDKYYIWWGFGNATKVKIEYYNILTEEVYNSFESTNSLILQYAVFNPSDYNISDNTYVGVRITPFDNNGNYGPIYSLGFIAHSDIVVDEPWSDSPYIEPVLNINGLDDVRPYINKYTVTTTIPNTPSNPRDIYSPSYVVDVDTTEIERLLQYIIDNMNNNVSDNPQQIIINTPVTYEPVDTEFDTPSFKNDFKSWKNGVVDYLMQFNGTPFGEPFAHLVTIILILSGLALALLIIKRL